MSQVLVFEVRTTQQVLLAEAWVDVDRMGERHRVQLGDDGEGYDDAPYDGVFHGSVKGPFAADINTTLTVRTADTREHILYQGVILLDDAERALVAWRLSLEGKELTAWRTATDWPTGKALVGDQNLVFVGLGWLVVLIVFVGMLFETAPPRAGRAPPEGR